MPTSSLPLTARLFITAVVAAGALVILDAWQTMASQPVGYAWVVLALLATVSSAFPVRVPGMSASLSTSEAFIFSSLLMFGPAPAILTVAADGLILSLVAKKKRVHRAVFNTAQPALSLWVAAQVLLLVAPDFAGAGSGSPTRVVLGLLCFTVTYFLSNSGLNAIAVGTSSGLPIRKIWWELRSVGVNSLGGIAFAVLLSQSASPLNVVALAALPLLLTTFYITFRHSMANAEEARSHLERLNKLYLSTIETLAMAIDAKDQVTHGHIRRVQLFAVGLAKALGVKDTSELKAIEAAALLHDMGKLAIPEHILNKPGKLSPAEFEQMKQHAAIGADILSRIDFPYPVVPIVRHHHEHWNGKGYPDGLSGPDIPIGARILSVVDCYDALTSDRPYRRALSDRAALDILIERRGNMYDPQVVDTFLMTHKELLPDDVDLPPAALAFDEAAAPSASEGGVLSEPESPFTSQPVLETALPAIEVLHALAGTMSVREIGDTVGARLRARIPASLCALYLYDSTQDDLVLSRASGEDAAGLEGFRIGLGDRLTGWVGANRRAIRNSDGALDFSGAPVRPSRQIRSCLSTPLMTDGVLVGVLSLYAEKANAYSAAHQAMLERVAGPLAHLLRAVRDLAGVRADAADALIASLPAVDEQAAMPDPHEVGAVVVVEVAEESTPLLAHAALCMRSAMKRDGRLLRDARRRLVGVLPGGTRADAERLVDLVAGELVDLEHAQASVAASPHTFSIGVSDTRFCLEPHRLRTAYRQAREAVCPLTSLGRRDPLASERAS